MMVRFSEIRIKVEGKKYVWGEKGERDELKVEYAEYEVTVEHVDGWTYRSTAQIYCGRETKTPTPTSMLSDGRKTKRIERWGHLNLCVISWAREVISWAREVDEFVKDGFGAQSTRLEVDRLGWLEYYRRLRSAGSLRKEAL